MVSGTVRICKLLADGRRHIVGFCFAGDAFGWDSGEGRPFTAEAVSDAVMVRFFNNPSKFSDAWVLEKQLALVAKLGQ